MPCCVNMRPRAGGTVLPFHLGRFARTATARRIRIRLRVAFLRNSPQAGLGSLGCRSALGLRPRLSPRFARPSLRSAATPVVAAYGNSGGVVSGARAHRSAPCAAVGHSRSVHRQSAALCFVAQFRGGCRSIAASRILPRLAAPGAHRARRLALRHASSPSPHATTSLGGRNPCFCKGPRRFKEVRLPQLKSGAERGRGVWRRARRRWRFGQAAPRRDAMREAARSGETCRTLTQPAADKVSR